SRPADHFTGVKSSAGARDRENCPVAVDRLRVRGSTGRALGQGRHTGGRAMAYTLLESAAHGSMRDYGVQVVGGLEARPALAAEAAPWHGMIDRIVAERAASERARDAVTMASTLVRVEDVDFDLGVGDLSSTSYHLS